MARALIPLLVVGILALFAYVAFSPTAPTWVKHLLHLAIGAGLIGLVVACGWAVMEVLSRTA